MSRITPTGFVPVAPAPHGPQPVFSNDPNHRASPLLRELSRVTVPRKGPIYLVVAPKQCGMCTNGNVIYVDPGFVRTFSDEELLVTLAHEVAHGDLGHIGKPQAAGALVTLIFNSIGSGRSGEEVAHSLTKAFVMAQFSQKQEVDADTEAAIYLNNLASATGRKLETSGPLLMANAISKLQALDRSRWTSWFSSHPSLPDRIKAMRQFQDNLMSLVNWYESHEDGSVSATLEITSYAIENGSFILYTKKGTRVTVGPIVITPETKIYSGDSEIARGEFHPSVGSRVKIRYRHNSEEKAFRAYEIHM